MFASNQKIPTVLSPNAYFELKTNFTLLWVCILQYALTVTIDLIQEIIMNDGFQVDVTVLSLNGIKSIQYVVVQLCLIFSLYTFNRKNIIYSNMIQF